MTKEFERNTLPNLLTSLAAISHELRAPLAAIIGYAELLRTETDAAARISSAETIHRNGQHLLQLVNDVVDLARIDAGENELHYAPCFLSEMVTQVGEVFLLKAGEKKIALDVSVDKILSEAVVSDVGRVRQILTNLLGNAVKFTDAGCVTLHAGLLNVAGGLTFIAVVSDTGPGISPEFEGKLFHPFTRDAAQKPGAGLGLAISHSLARALGGILQFRRPLEGGSSFVLEIPVKSASGAVKTESSFASKMHEMVLKEGHYAKRVLVVEDTEDLQLLFVSFVKKLGYDVTAVGNGMEAIRAISVAESRSDPFDAIVLDMNMPVLDGYETARCLRASGSQIPILALTANALAGDLEKCLSAGCTEFLSKPVKSAELGNALQKLLLTEVQAYVLPTPSKLVGAFPGEKFALQEFSLKHQTPLISESLDEIAPHLLRSFVERLDARMTCLDSAIESSAFDAIEIICHKLQGSAGSFGFPVLAQATAHVAELARTTEDLTHLRVAFADLYQIVILVQRGFSARNTDRYYLSTPA
jgi:two-component system, sensor histidine kinase